MKLRFIGLAVLVVLLLSALALPALAHEEREVGDYNVEFGWRVEPVYAGLLNGPEFFVSQKGAEEGTAFPADIDVSVQVEVSFGSESMTIPLEPAEGETGHYVADLIPTLPGDYSFRVFGNIGDQQIDEVFTSADGMFGTVEPATDIMFPVAGISDVATLQARIDELEARLAALESK